MIRKYSGKMGSVFLYLFFFLCLLPIGFHIYKHPDYNFDMLGYMALVVRMDQTTAVDQVHNITYSNAKQNIPEEEYKKLTTTPPFRQKFASDPVEFQKLLPIYIVKPLYLWMCYLFYKAGASLTIATVLPSLLSFFLIGIFLFHWLKKYLQPVVAFLGALLIMYSSFVTNVARLSTPDCLSAFFLFVAAYYVLERRHMILMFLFFLLSILTRVDNLIICFFVISFLSFDKKLRLLYKKQYFFMLLVLVITYLCIMLQVRQFGWSIFYYSQYARHIDFSKDFKQAVSSSSYISLVYSKLVTAVTAFNFSFFMFIAMLIMGYPLRRFKNFTFDQLFLLLMVATILFRFLLLPDLSDRFYLGFYLIIIILLVRRVVFQTANANNENH
ncbi:MAG: ArnT family glycosyltransferase [Flavisolibacter sp.]